MAVQIKKARLLILCFALSLLVKGAETHYKQSDFKITNGVISEHDKIKEGVKEFLSNLAEESEGLVIEQIEQERWKHMMSAFGSTINILVSGAALAILPIPVPSGAESIIGYAFIGGSKWYEMRCSEEHAEKLASIHKRLHTQLNLYTSSQEKVFKELDKYELFEHGKNFEENLDAIRALVRKAEKQSEEKMVNIKKFLSKLEGRFYELDDNNKENLSSMDFLMSVGRLIGNTVMTQNNKDGGRNKDGSWMEEAGRSVIGTVLGCTALDTATGGSKVLDTATGGCEFLDTATGVTASTYIHGLNLLANLGFLVTDIKNIIELNNMRDDWYKGGKEKQLLLKNSKYEAAVNMKKLINQIRDKIMEDGN